MNKTQALVGVLSLFLSLTLQAGTKKNEGYYSNLLCQELGGVPEKKVKYGRVDCLTPTHAIEVDWFKGSKHYECTAQAQYYGYMTGKLPKCILIHNKPLTTYQKEKYNFLKKYWTDTGNPVKVEIHNVINK